MFRHESGSLKQHNKKFKSKFATKSELRKRNKGKVGNEGHTSVKAKQVAGSKNARKNARRDIMEEKQQQLRKRDACLPPRVIGVIPLVPEYQHFCLELKQELMLAAGISQDDIENKGHLNLFKNSTFYSTINKTRLSVVVADGTIGGCLDVVRGCDHVVYAVPCEFITDGSHIEEASQILGTLCAYGSPTATIAVKGLDSLKPREQKEAKVNITAFFGSFYAQSPKLYSFDSFAVAPQSDQMLLRGLCVCSTTIPKWREGVPALLAEEVVSNAEGRVVIKGYLRGANTDCDHAVYIPGVGAQLLDKIDVIADPNAVRNHGPVPQIITVTPTEEQANLVSALPRPNDDLEMDDDHDHDDHHDAMDRTENKQQQSEKKKKLVPIGTSAYQATWIVDDDNDSFDENDENNENDDLDIDDSDKELDHEAAYNMLRQANLVKGDKNDLDEEEEKEELVEAPEEDEPDGKHVHFGDDVEDASGDENDNEFIKKWREEREHLEFPNEIEIHPGEKARERLARYRGLESFRTSPWDPKESLPADYARIFQFQNYASTKKHVLLSEGACARDGPVCAGSYVALTVRDLAPAALEAALGVPVPQEGKRDATLPVARTLLTVTFLRAHEVQTSVDEAIVRRPRWTDTPVKGRETLLACVGARRFFVAPTFARADTRSPKIKMERFLPQEGDTCATFYGPITFPPAPVLLFRVLSADKTNITKTCNVNVLNEPTNVSRRIELVASGGLSGTDPDRVVLKEVVLTGYAMRVHKRTAIVRGMFFNPADVLYFRCVGIRTSGGRVGSILEPVGTHGRMRCVFDNTLQQNETIYMRLYKRTFPKWCE